MLLQTTYRQLDGGAERWQQCSHVKQWPNRMERPCFGSISRYFVCLRIKQITLGKNIHLGSLSLLIHKSQGMDSNDQCKLMLTGKVPSQKEKGSISFSEMMLLEKRKM